ncbi:SBBP repeat-containing protein [Paludibaculum fermentans]|uniref:SBBP repeat-containing protein n=1 Tax=Paludibaculum fermentans TaxID=1473598 RepID=A0A7S7NVC0_PALFE|nr:SBBP repeat-containing protein [Paludibaculum fermentans]QOY90497.1 SBBP repeat-containing protein [Paludibaculum fermentans]
MRGLRTSETNRRDRLRNHAESLPGRTPLASGTGVTMAPGYLGGTAIDDIYGMAKDADGNLVVAGDSTSAELKATAGAVAHERGDVFVQKLKADGSAVLWTARLGGTQLESATAVTVDAKGDVYVTGWTASSDFPTSSNAFQRFGQGGDDAFVAKLSGKDGSLVYCTLLGGTKDENPQAISVDAAGIVAITGHTDSTNFPTQAAGSRGAFSGGPGAMIARLNATGSALVSSTVLTGNGWVKGFAIASLADGTFQLAGASTASDLPMVKSFQKSHQSAGVWHSGNAGRSWIPGADGMRGVQGESMVIDPSNPQMIYVATKRGVYKSSDGGFTWKAANSGLTSAATQYLAVDPKTPTTLYVATSTVGVFKSTDGGANWSAANSGLAKNAWQITLDPQNPKTLYATTSSSGIMKSTDGGDSWNNANTGIDEYFPYIIQISVDPQTPANLYAAGYLSVYRSRDAGLTWTPLNAGPSDEIYTSVHVDESNPSTIYASSYFSGSYRSTDGGASWQPMRSGLSPYLTVYEFRAGTNAPGVVYAATDYGIYKSLNYGQTWTQPAAELSNHYIYGLALNPLDKNIVYSCGQLAPDGVVVHFDKDGQSILQSTYLGGDGDDEIFGMAIGPDGSVHVTGFSESPDFPTTPGAPQTVIAGEIDAFVATFDNTLGTLPFSTLLGGDGADIGMSLAIEPGGTLAAAGWTGSLQFPVTGGLGNAPLGGSTDMFLARVSPTAPGFALTTLLGGSGLDSATAVVATDSGAWVGGYTTSRDLTGTLAGASAGYLGGASDALLVRVAGLSADAAFQQTSLTFDILLDGGPLTQEKTVTVTSAAGALPLVGKVPADAAWLKAVPNPQKAGELLIRVDATGLVAGEYKTAIEVSSPLAGVATTPVAVTLRVKNATPPVLTTVLHQAERTAQAIAPGLPILLQGDGFLFASGKLTPDPAAEVLPTTLGRVSVTINGTPAPLESVEGTLISAITPFGLTGDRATIVVTRDGLGSAPIDVALTPTAPGLFTTDGSGQGQARAENEDGTTNTVDNAAEHGHPIILHATGAGIMTPALADGQLVTDADHHPDAKVEVFIGGLPCDVYYSGAAPGRFAGYLDLNLKVPDEVTPGPAVPVVLRIGGKDSTQTVTIAVR